MPPTGGLPLAAGTNWPPGVLTKSRGVALAIRSFVQYATVRSCWAAAGSRARTGTTAIGSAMLTSIALSRAARERRIRDTASGDWAPGVGSA